MLLRHMKPKLVVPRRELEALCRFFRIGLLRRYHRIRKGNINTNYYVRTETGEYVIRFYTFKSEPEVEAEHEILLYLYAYGFPTPKPLKKNGGTYTKWKGKTVCCFSYIHGHYPKKHSVRHLKDIAQMTAQLHLLTANFHQKKPLSGEGVNEMRKGIQKVGPELRGAGFRGADTFLSVLKRELSHISFPKTLPRGVCHVDIKSENLLFRHAFEALLDFDNAYIDAFVIDIGSCLLWWCFDGNRLNECKMHLFLKEYEKLRPLTSQERAYLLPALKFNILKQAFKYAYICLPKKMFAEREAYAFLQKYKYVRKMSPSF